MDSIPWFKEFRKSKECEYMKRHPIVYFCAEYALDDALPTYAGGLGILAGDMIREAAEQKIPFIAVGLLYREGYSPKKSIPLNSRNMNLQINLQPVLDSQNKRIIVKVPVRNSYISVQAWVLHYGSADVYLLDTDISENTEQQRHIVDQLYPSSKDVRFKQEIVLGLGGLRLLDSLHISPSGYHLNEGHSALLALEVTYHEMKKHSCTFEEELENTKKHIFFTNHTLLPAGNDTYSTDLVSDLLSGYAEELHIPVSEIINLGTTLESEIFSMTHLALRMAGKINAVSQLHAEKAGEIWSEYPMIPITNGIHIKSWDSLEDEANMWKEHQSNKQVLLKYINELTEDKWDENTLLIGWARRIVSYKRPLGLFDNLEQFKEIASSSDRPIRVAISGIVHQNDEEGITILKQINTLVKHELKGIVCYIPGYNMAIAKLLVSGCDIWLNTPVVGFEACGTSGMKAALNGVLPLSTPDGWVAEANLFNVGWPLDSGNVSRDILSVLQKQILPLYYNRDNKGISQSWVNMMQNARDMTLNQFSTTIMLRKYIEKFYLPIIKYHEEKEKEPLNA